MRSTRRQALNDLYLLLADLREKQGGYRFLRSAHGRTDWPRHGVYFFFEPGEMREDGRTPRVTRVGTHALTETSRTTLWDRLRQHRGTVGGGNPGGGNHRGSIFRLHVGSALIRRDGWPEAAATWGDGSSAPREVRAQEVALERAVSEYIGAMPFLWLAVRDRNDRSSLERGAISLLSNLDREPIDPPSPAWLGHHADREAMKRSGLWNVHHADASPDPAVVRLVESALKRAGS